MDKRIRAAATLLAVLAAWAGAGHAADPSALVCTGGKIAELPVTMSDRRPLVSARVDGQEMSFIADSGAVFSMISPASAARLKLPLRDAPRGFGLSGVGGAIDVRVARVKRFDIGGHGLRDIDFFVGGGDTGAVGLLGQNILSVADTHYDLGGGMIRLVNSGNCPDRVLADWAAGEPYATMEIEPVTPSHRHISGAGSINGARLRVVFDTGAPTTLLSLAAARRAGLNPGTPGVIPAGTANGLGGKVVQSWRAPAVSYRIGGKEMRNDPLRIADMGDVPFDLLIGADFFLAHRVYVASSQSKLHFNVAERPRALPPLADAEAYSRRGAAAAARRDLKAAIEDFTRAIALAPNEPRYLLQRAMARLDNREELLARFDLDQAIMRKADFVEALQARAVLFVVERNFASAQADLRTATKAAPREADQRYTFAALYAGMEDWRRSLEQFDLWIPTHQADSRQASALNARCWARAMLNDGLEKALDDCDAALRAQPDSAEYLDSRGMVLLRMGRWRESIAEYDKVLAKKADSGGWSLFGRGLAKLRAGREQEGKADIAAAIVIQQDIIAKAIQWGLISSAADPR